MIALLLALLMALSFAPVGHVAPASPAMTCTETPSTNPQLGTALHCE